EQAYPRDIGSRKRAVLARVREQEIFHPGDNHPLNQVVKFDVGYFFPAGDGNEIVGNVDADRNGLVVFVDRLSHEFRVVYSGRSQNHTICTDAKGRINRFYRAESPTDLNGYGDRLL